jgi:ATP-binding cassette subfamily C protein EexD
MKNPDTELEVALKHLKKGFYSTIGFSLLINLFVLAPTIYMMEMYNTVVPTGNTTTLWMLTLIVMLVFISMASLEWVRSQILVRLSSRLELELNPRLFNIAFRQSLYSGGQRISTQPVDDIAGLRQFLSSPALFILVDIPFIPIYLLGLFLLHPWYGWFSLVTAFFSTLIAIATDRATSALLSEANNTLLATRGRLSKSLQNAEIVHALGMGRSVHRRWLDGANRVLDLQANASMKAGFLTMLSKLLRMISQSLILGLGAYLVVKGEVSGGALFAGQFLMGRALGPIDMMIGSWKSFNSAQDQYQRLNQLLAKVPADKNSMRLPNPQGRLQLENMVVVPPNGKFAVLKGLNLSIEKGDIVGVLGPSGAGKSSLARAILGIWPTNSGFVRLDGAEIFHWNRDELGGFIGYLPQDIELFEGTVSENIARLNVIDHEKVEAAAKMADVHELILSLPNGYDTVIGATGGFLSGGQRQRIALARALYGDPVLVVLDEPNSNLDEQGVKALENTLLQLKQKQTTVLLITHRNDILSKVDKLLILKEGTLAVYGPKDQVIAHLQQKAA